MTCSVVEVEPGFPQRPSRERIDVLSARSFREPHRGNGDMSLEHERVMPAHFGAWRADGDGPRDVGGAIGILATGIGEVERSRLELQIAHGGGPVMHHSAMRPRSGDAVKTYVLELTRLAPKILELHCRTDLIDPA